MRPVSLVWRGQVIIAPWQRCRKWIIAVYVPAIVRLPLGSESKSVVVAKKFDPERIKPPASSISEICRRIGIIQFCQNGVRRVSDYQEWNIIAVHQVTAVGAWVQRIGGRGIRLCD